MVEIILTYEHFPLHYRHLSHLSIPINSTLIVQTNLNKKIICIALYFFDFWIQYILTHLMRVWIRKCAPKILFPLFFLAFLQPQPSNEKDLIVLMGRHFSIYFQLHSRALYLKSKWKNKPPSKKNLERNWESPVLNEEEGLWISIFLNFRGKGKKSSFRRTFWETFKVKFYRTFEDEKFVSYLNESLRR